MNWKTLRGMLAIALVALIASACSVSRQTAVNSVSSSTIQDSRDSVRVEQVMVAVHDTIVETTTIIVRENEQGDTLRLDRVTDRERVRSMSDVRRQKEEVRVVRDTVYVAVRDSTRSEVRGLKADGASARASPFVSALKWVFWIIVAIGALVIGWKVSKIFSFRF